MIEARADQLGREDLRRRSRGEHLPLAQQQRVAGAGRELLQVMRDEHGRQAGTVGAQLVEAREQPLTGGDVQARGGLVEEQQRRHRHRDAVEQRPPLPDQIDLVRVQHDLGHGTSRSWV
ncbi:hypothetical protein [Actinomadura sp. B10D3]|uniref:hypothetical protein n=1 Tax=Actinomadura sp. B10D3 TaxID=3153557 RepID=UPI00325CD332